MMVVSIAVLIAPVMPHHHHNATEICLRHDINPDDMHHHQQSHPDHNDEDPCCNNECMTKLHSLTASSNVDWSPQHTFIMVLFDDFTISSLLAPQERLLKRNYVYIETLHSVTPTNQFSRRGPPVVCRFAPSFQSEG
jgi:hypothetical protein